MKIAAKFLLVFILVMCGVLGGSAYFQIRKEINLYEEDIRKDHVALGQLLAQTARMVGKISNLEDAIEAVENANKPRGSIKSRWIWLDDPPGSPHGPFLTPEKIRLLLKGAVVYFKQESGSARGTFYTYIPLLNTHGPPAALELSESLDPENVYVKGVIRQEVLNALFLMTLSGCLVMLLGMAMIGRPMRQLVSTARKIGFGDLTGSLHLPQKDEMGELATEINLMCTRLLESRNALNKETAAHLDTLEQLRHADRLMTVGKLASGIAHELGTPLNVIYARAKMVMNGEAKGDEAIHCATVIREQSERMTHIIRQLLDFARSRKPVKSREDLRSIIRRTFELLEPIAQKKGVVLLSAGDEAPSFAQVDPNQIQQALTNLVVNGMQAMKDGGEIIVALARQRVRPPIDHGGPEDEYFCLSVEDHGAGIRPENLNHIFSPFFTTKDVGEGTGLGLSVAHGLVKEHKGWITVKSEWGKGSLFSIYLPKES